MFWKSQSSTFSFQPVWGLQARGQHADTILHLGCGGGVLSFCRTTQRYESDCISLEEELGLCFIAELLFKVSLLFLLDCFPLFLHSLTSLISNCLCLLFGTPGKLRRL